MRGNEDGGKAGGDLEADREFAERTSNISRGRNVTVEFCHLNCMYDDNYII